MKRNVVALLAALVLVSVPASAQITIPFPSFTSGSLANPDEVNSNNSTLATTALNRTGGTITGNIVVNAAVTIDGIDIGAVLGGTGTPTFATVTTTGAIVGGGTIAWGGGAAIGSSSNIPLLNAANTFTGTNQVISNWLTIDRASSPFVLFAEAGVSKARVGAVGTALVFSSGDGTEKARFETSTSTFAWGGGAAIASSGNIPLLNAVNTFTGFGTHGFTTGGTGSNELKVANTTAGTANTAYVGAYNDLGLTGYLQVFSSTYTTSGPNVASGMLLGAGRAGGISVAATDASGPIRFYAGGTVEDVRIHASGGVSVGDVTDPGATNFRVTGTTTSIGQITGNVTGNLTGNVTGNLTGNVTGNLTGNVTGNASGTAATVTGAAQAAITSVGTLTQLIVSGAAALGQTTTSGGWGINAAGDWTFGASSHIALSSSTPTIASGAGTSPSIAGTASAFIVTIGTGATGPIVVSFARTFNSAPPCVAGADASASITVRGEPTTTQVTLYSTAYPAGTKFQVHCVGY